MEKINLPENVRKIIEKLEERGFEGFAVGGCVRDSLLGKTPTDWDITTNALPEQMKKIFKKTFDTGIAHGTITVLMEGIGYEITTYRIDGNYSDGRHPDSVSFSRNLSEDLCRRDFTINAMAYSPGRGIIDLYAGIRDLNEGIIRAVGKAKKRFEEDALRMLRAVRFSVQLGFEIEEETFKAISESAPLLSKVSKERIFVELNKSLMGDFAGNLRFVYDTGLYKYIGNEFRNIPEEFYYIYPGKPGNKKHLCWALFLKNIQDTQDVKKILFELKSDKLTVKNTFLLVEELQSPLRKTDEDIRWSLNRMGYELFEDYINILKSDREYRSISEEVKDMERRYNNIKKEKQAVNTAMLNISGKELLDIGLAMGPAVGILLDYILKKVIANPELNKKDELIKIAKDYILNNLPTK